MLLWEPERFRVHLKCEPYIQRFLVSRHIVFYRTPDLLHNLSSYFALSWRAGSGLFCTNLTCAFYWRGSFFDRLYRASYPWQMSAKRMTESQGLEYRHLFHRRYLTVQIRYSVNTKSPNLIFQSFQVLGSATLFSSLSVFSCERFARPFLKVPVLPVLSW